MQINGDIIMVLLPFIYLYTALALHPTALHVRALPILRIGLLEGVYDNVKFSLSQEKLVTNTGLECVQLTNVI